MLQSENHWSPGLLHALQIMSSRYLQVSDEDAVAILKCNHCTMNVKSLLRYGHQLVHQRHLVLLTSDSSEKHSGLTEVLCHQNLVFQRILGADSNDWIGHLHCLKTRGKTFLFSPFYLFLDNMEECHYVSKTAAIEVSLRNHSSTQ